MKNPGEYLSWDDVEYCLNNPQFYFFEMINPNEDMKVEIPEHSKSWIWNKKIQDKAWCAKRINEGWGFVITNYAFHSLKTNELLKEIESIFAVNAAIHVYCGLDDATSFPIHDDYSANFIFQVEGETEWKIFNNRVSYMHKVGIVNNKVTEDQLEVALHVTLKPGDALYIPSRMLHCAYPKGQRLSMSVPCWNRFPTDPQSNSIDRNYYRINHDRNI
jgi:hypothetical protein